MNESSTVESIWKNLCSWIQSHGGQVHGGLELRRIAEDDNNRGVYATRSIAPGEVLIRLPRTLAIDGRSMPRQYEYDPETSTMAREASSVTQSTCMEGSEPGKRYASPWLRCLAAYYKESNHHHTEYEPTHTGGTISKQIYLQSLPEQYETVSLSWEKDQIDSFLAGTSTTQPQGGPGPSLTTNSTASCFWKDNDHVLKERYLGQIRPYLHGCGIVLEKSTNGLPATEINYKQEIQKFLLVSQCLSTRCFHVMMPTDAKSMGDEYTGPYLLPCMDLLNHCSSTDKQHKATTLKGTSEWFVMHAERPISAGEEICHSYGDDLTSCQFLQTFGFVEQRTIEILAGHSEKQHTALRNPTPVLIPKQLVLEACWAVIESGLPQRLAKAMEEAGMEDEVWTVQVDRSRRAEFLPDHILVQRGGGESAVSSLSDSLVTLACAPFLPSCAYREAAQALIGKEILEDYFLGHLVCTSLLSVIKQRLALYKPIVWNGIPHENDQLLLQNLLCSATNDSKPGDNARGHSVEKQRAIYGLALRLDEKATLDSLRRELLELLSNLDSSGQESDENEDDQGLSKRIKTA